MADDQAEDAVPPADIGRARRAPPTIDLQASEVATQPQQPADEPQQETDQERVKAEPEPEQVDTDAAPGSDSPATNSRSSTPISPWVIAPFSGAVAAALVIGVGWMLGWPRVQAPPALQAPPAIQAPPVVQAPPAPQVTTAAVDALSSRLASIEAKVNKPAPPKVDAILDPATTSRIDRLENSLNALRSDVASLHSPPGLPSNSRDGAVSAPHDAAAAPDLSGINERIALLERGIQAQRTELSQLGERIADAKSAADKADSDNAASDKPLRRAVAAALLDVAVRNGDGYALQLSAARSLAAKPHDKPDDLKPLDAFASSGIPSPVALSRELVDIVPKLLPAAEAQTNGSGIVDRMQTSAKTFFSVERIDGSSAAIISRVTAAAQRGDFNEARRELKSLPEADREPAKAWLDKADERDAALAASRKFADDAMAELAKPALSKPVPAKPAEQQPAQ